MLQSLRAFPASIDNQLIPTVMAGAERVGRQWTVEAAPVRSGFLRSRIYTAPAGPSGFWLISGAPYSAPVEYGSRAHEILPVRAKALRFRGRGGEFVFRRRVWHPGTRAQPFMMPTVERLRVWVREELIRKLDAVLRAVGFK